MSLLSLAALTILDAGPAGQIRAAAAAGFEAVGLRLNPLLPTDARVVGDKETEAEIIALLAEHKMKVLEIGVFPITPDLNIAALMPVIAFSSKIGARFIVCPVEDDNEDRRTANFAMLCDAAADYGLTPLIEFNPYSACKSLNGALALLERAQRSNAALVIDALHLSRSGGSPKDLARIDPWLIELVHFCDAPAFDPKPRTVDELRQESRTARMLPGEGALWLHELLAVLPDHTGISVEAPSARTAHLSATERAKLAYDATMAVLRAQG